jgi:hypothetical protein
VEGLGTRDFYSPSERSPAVAITGLASVAIRGLR